MLHFAKVCVCVILCVRVRASIYNVCVCVYFSFLSVQDAYTGYEFEARLNFKVHSALTSIR